MKVDIAELKALEEKGLVRSSRHNSFPLTIYKYTEQCVFGREWTDLLLMCRGLIVHDNGDVIARPFKKFFNIEEHEGEDSKLPPLNWNQGFRILDKLDGSLGIAYRWEGENHIATVGSFHSDQAKWANYTFHQKGYAEKIIHEEKGRNYTNLFEIIYPANRIVVNYEDMEDLVLLDIIDIESGQSCSGLALDTNAEAIGCPVVKMFGVTRDVMTPRDNAEGYVIRFNDGTMAKAKFEEYKRLHAIVTGVSAKQIWEALRNKMPLNDYLEHVPDEFYKWVKGTIDNLNSDYDEIEKRARFFFDDMKRTIKRTPKEEKRRHFAQLVNNYTKDISGVMFKMYEERDYSENIWKLIKPKGMLSPFRESDA